MESDERFRWIEVRVTSFLKPRVEELKQLFSLQENRYKQLILIFPKMSSESRISFIPYVINFCNGLTQSDSLQL